MFIKELTICGFKSYKDVTTLTDLSNELNVIVGRNGSEKSNIFSAIEFALTSKYRSLNPEARSSLISHGRAPQDPSYVEIVFDNTDRKLPINSDTVKFRRMLATKKDRFFVNGKELTHAKQFLDVAGFTNPYFIVKQGKVHDLALASDKNRLKVISDVTGTTIFDKQIADCRQSIQDAEAKKKGVEKLMLELKERKESLEAEVGDQTRFMKLDRSKRGLEYMIVDRKLKEAQTNLADLEKNREQARIRQGPVKRDLEKIQRDLHIYKRDLAEIAERLKQLQEVKKDYESARNEIAANLVSRKQELQDRQSRNSQTSEASNLHLDKEISRVKKQLEKAEMELTNLKLPFEKKKNEKCQLEERVKIIREKELRKNKFKKPGNFQNHLDSQLRDLSVDLNQNRTRMRTYAESENTAKENLILETERLQTLRESLSSCLTEINAINQQVEQQQALDCTTKGKLDAMHRELSEVELKLAQKKERVSRLEEECKKFFGQGILQGWMGVRKIVEDFRFAGMYPEVVEGYYGLLCEVIQCDPKLDSAVETAGGKKLVHHVVQSPQVAEALLLEFNRRQYRGEVNFIPVDTLRPGHMTVPDGLKGAKPIISLLQYDDKFSPVVKFVFGNTLLCVDLETAADMMRQHMIQCVTMEGEKVSKNEVMTGGYVQFRPQKLELQRAKAADEAKLAEYTARKSDLDAASNKLREEYRTIQTHHEQLRMEKARLGGSKRLILSQIETSEKKIITLKKHVETAEQNIKEVTQLISVLEERDRVLNSSTEDKAKAVEDSRRVANEYSKIEKDFAAKQHETASLEAKLQQLYKQYYQEVEMSSQNEKEASGNIIVHLMEVISSLTEQLSEAQAKLDKAVEDAAVYHKATNRKQKSVDELNEKETKIRDELRKLCTDLESHTGNQAHWQQKLHEHNEEFKNLGSIPPNMERFEGLDDKVLYSKLKKVNLKLKGCSKVGINQQAVQQFEEVTEKYSQFEEKFKACRIQRKEMVALLRDAETKKGEAMLRNMRVLQQQFQEIFCSIVPKGNAELILYGDGAIVSHDEDIDREELLVMAGKSMFEGVKVAVNFVGKQLHQTQSLVQLSGGQKSIIALCIILAIQMIDPVPFYLFDEVDQALDTAYRDLVARVVCNMAERSQFICTTFRKEFVDVASRVFGVSYHQRKSLIQPITDTQAMDFVESDTASSESQSGSSQAGTESDNPNSQSQSIQSEP